MKLSILLLVGLLLLPAHYTAAEDEAIVPIADTPVGGREEAAAPTADTRVRPIEVAASIYPITMLTREIGGDRIVISTVIPPGADPHHFEITPSSARSVYDADVVFMIGADFDSWILSPEPTNSQMRVELYKALSDSLIELGDTFNPHFWLDPLIAGKMGEHIGLTLITVDYAGRSHYEERMAAFRARVDSLHAAVNGRIERSGFERFISFHPAWTYFARRYSMIEVGVIERLPGYEPSARWVAGLISEVQRQGVEFVIVEDASDPGIVRGIESDTQVSVLTLDPIGRPDLAPRSTYFGLIDYNVSLIEKAAGGIGQ